MYSCKTEAMGHWLPPGSPDCALVPAREGGVVMGVYDGPQSGQQVRYGPNKTRSRTLKAYHNNCFLGNHAHTQNFN